MISPCLKRVCPPLGWRVSRIGQDRSSGTGDISAPPRIQSCMSQNASFYSSIHLFLLPASHGSPSNRARPPPSRCPNLTLNPHFYFWPWSSSLYNSQPFKGTVHLLALMSSEPTWRIFDECSHNDSANRSQKRHPRAIQVCLIFSAKQKEMLNQMHDKADREQGPSRSKNAMQSILKVAQATVQYIQSL